MVEDNLSILDRIRDMKAKGLTNNQIIQTLQREGINMSQIFNAMNQTTLSPPSGIEKAPDLNIRASQVQSMPQQFNQPVINPQMPIKTMPPIPPTSSSFSNREVEELVEAVIEEKWTGIEDDINKIIEWKDAIEERISKIEQSLDDLKKEFDKLQTSVIGKVTEYDKHIMNVGAEVQAMEKAFSKVLPAFVDNVAMLDQITTRLKQQSTSKK